jgi:hypothetical protein
MEAVASAPLSACPAVGRPSAGALVTRIVIRVADPASYAMFAALLIYGVCFTCSLNRSHHSEIAARIAP